MKKLLLLRFKLCLGIIVFTIISSSSPFIAASQLVKYKVYAHCCTCYGLFHFGYAERIGGTCFLPECRVLCPNCRQKLGNLNVALERLKGKNRGLKEAYDAFEAQYADALAKYNAALERTFGKEAGGVPSTWDYINLFNPTGQLNPFTTRGYTGLKGSFGSWFTAQLSLESSFAAPEYKEAVTLVTNGISIYQSGFTATPDGGMTWAGIYCDYIGGNKVLNTSLYQDELKTLLTEYTREINAGTPLDIATRNYNAEVVKSYEKIDFSSKVHDKMGIILDAIGLALATKTLLDDVWDVLNNYEEKEIALKQLGPITDSIMKNDSTINCIRRTIDYINNGGTGFQKAPASSPLAISTLTLFIAEKELESLSLESDYKLFIIPNADPAWKINVSKMETALDKLRKLSKVQKQMDEIIKKQFYPNTIPWGTRIWEEVKPAVLLKMLKNTKTAFPLMLAEYKKMIPLAESIFQDLMSAITSIEVDYFAASEPEGYITTVHDANGDPSNTNEKWTNTPNEKIKKGFGRLNLTFPADADWTVDVYSTENKFITNRSSFSKHTSYEIAPGNYNLKLYGVAVGNVTIENGKETKLKSGILNIVSRDRWELYDATRKIYYTSGIKPVKFVLPVGSYVFNYDGKDYPITIKNGMILKFDLRKPFLVD